MSRNDEDRKEKRRFPSNIEGLSEFLGEFRVYWKLFQGILDVVESSALAKKFEERKCTLVRHAQTLADNDGSESEYVRTIGYGIHLLRDIRDFLENLIEEDTAEPYFDSKIHKIREISATVWKEFECAVLDTRSKFTTANKGDDLVEIVGRYAEVLRHIRAVKMAAEDELRARRRQEEAARRHDRSEKARVRAKDLISTIA